MQPSAATPTSPATIVPLVAADHAEWAPLWRRYLDFYRAAVDAKTSETTFARLTGGAEPMGGFLARDDDGAAIGLVHWIVHRSCWTVGDYCYLQDLFVAPGRRGGGVGRRLIDAVAAKARELGCSRVHWLTHETNRDAMRLYDKVAERSGFVQYRIRIG
ncbi:MAG: GNAT family N-acetyltransferase [Roseiarcus sp.]|jgi:GNAT superfamily N-acetyltransferase